ncbi:hypothetical protein OB955_06155 [Halobacteria archaeon AArc-m2/3/4]|uniref:Uncharacterized protein n=1 Tax=Natronoglomus mannanivorans TaxID=2979990 RepID=A0AAP2YYR3_9EURY|nr:hypothetical protein [Halobacteria archaeon AArc-xg1-1]MCU4972317.1 hypothetical protein [Halobacteria archaeon AArc-m2/3/4]
MSTANTTSKAEAEAKANPSSDPDPGPDPNATETGGGGGGNDTGTNVEDVLEAVTVTHKPARLSGGLAVGCGLLAVLTSAPATIIALLIGVFGLAGLAAGQFVLESRRAAGVGTALIFVGVLVSGVLGNSEVLVTVSTLATILAFDLSQNAFSVGAQMSSATDTTRGEIIHAAASFFVGSVAIVVAFAVYFVVGTGGQPIAALAFVLLAAVILSWSVRS